MKLFVSIVGAAIALSFATSASASVCAPNTWCFGATGSAQLVTQGNTYSIGLGSISVYSEQVNNSTNNIVSTIDGAPSHPTLGTGGSALFQTNDNVYDEGVGIAPYNPVEGSGSSFSNQDGISDTVTTGYDIHGNPITTSSYGNILEIELGANIAQGTSLAFLLQAGIGASSDKVDILTTAPTSTATSPVNPSSMSPVYTSLGGITTNGTNPTFSLIKNTSGIEFVAIEADCHYLLLDTITGSSTVPEPRFYGILLAGLLGLAGIAYQRRRAAQANA
jgi:hypothetical protein